MYSVRVFQDDEGWKIDYRVGGDGNEDYRKRGEKILEERTEDGFSLYREGGINFPRLIDLCELITEEKNPSVYRIKRFMIRAIPR